MKLQINNSENKLTGNKTELQEVELKMQERLKLIESELYVEFDEMFKDVFVDENGNIKNQDLYERKRFCYVVKQLEKEDELAELRELLERASSEKLALSRDSVSNLYRREFLFKKMDKKLRDLFDVVDGDKPEAIFEKILNKELSREDRAMLAVMSDMSFLSLANERTHEEGDELIAKVGKAWLEEGRSAFRHGGDEMTDLVEGKEADGYQKKIVDLKERVRNIKVGILESNGLRPNIDIGQASLGESLEIFKKLSDYKEFGEEYGKKFKEIISRNPLKELEGVWLQIADKRAAIDKGIERILLLVKMFKMPKESSKYQEVVDKLRKGGYGISDIEVAKLSEMNDEVKLMETAREMVINFEEKQMHKQKGEMELGDHFSMYKYAKSDLVHQLTIKDYIKPSAPAPLTPA